MQVAATAAGAKVDPRTASVAGVPSSGMPSPEGGPQAMTPDRKPGTSGGHPQSPIVTIAPALSKHLAAQSEAMKASVDLLKDLYQQKDEGASKAGEAAKTERANALTGIEFKQQIPQLLDSNPDFDGHFRKFTSIIDCHAYQRGSVRPMDVLTVYRRSLPENSVRLKMYETQVARAQRKGRLPHEAAAVMEEIKKKLAEAFKELQQAGHPAGVSDQLQ